MLFINDHNTGQNRMNSVITEKLNCCTFLQLKHPSTWHCGVGDFSVCGWCQGCWRSQQGQGATGRIMFIIPAFMHLQMKHEIPEGAQTLLVNVSSAGESQAEPRRTTNKQPPSNDCVRPGAGLKCVEVISAPVGPDHPLWPSPHLIPSYCCRPAAADNRVTTLSRWGHET